MTLSSFGDDAPYVIEVMSGKFFNLRNPTPEMVDLSDIEAGLFNNIRFRGQISRKFSILASVALHCCLVDDILVYEHEKYLSERNLATLRLHGLLHDAHEAYTGDISTPLKNLIGKEVIKDIQLRIDEAVHDALGLEDMSFYEDLTKEADTLSLRAEAATYLHSHGSWAGDPTEEKVVLWQNQLMQYLFGYFRVDWKDRVLECLEMVNGREEA